MTAENIIPRAKPSTLNTIGKDSYNFKFIEVGKLSQAQKDDSRSVIRAHVVRDFYKKKKDDTHRTTPVEPASSALLDQSQRQHTHRFKSGPSGLQEFGKRRKRKKIPSVEPPSTPAGNSQTREDAPIQQIQDGGAVEEGSNREWPSDYWRVLEAHIVIEGSPTASVVEQPGTLDPFSTLPLPNGPVPRHCYIMVNTAQNFSLYCPNRVIFSSPWMGQLRKEWLALATQDLALFHIALSHYAGNYGLQNQECDPVDALRFRVESMRIVNERIENNDGALIDGTLGTVASLSSYEATNGTLSAVSTHMTGLKRMVELRGGLHGSKTNEHIKRLILWADLTCATALRVDPAFSADAEDSLFDNNATALYNTSPNSGFRLVIDDDILPVLHKDLTDCFAALRNSYSLIEDNYQREVDKSVHIQRSDELYLIERKLLELANLSGPECLITGSCIAAIIFIDNHFRGIGFSARLMQRHVERLQHSMGLILGKGTILTATTRAQSTVFWMLCVGSIATTNRPERTYFVIEAGKIGGLLSIESCEDAYDVLRNFFWPSIWNDETSRIWEQIEGERFKI